MKNRITVVLPELLQVHETVPAVTEIRRKQENRALLSGKNWWGGLSRDGSRRPELYRVTPIQRDTLPVMLDPNMFPVSLEPWKRELIQRILASPAFALKDERIVELFVRLIEVSLPSPDKMRNRRTEASLKKDVPKLKALKRLGVLVGRLRSSLRRYFEVFGRHESWRVEIEEHSKRVLFIRQHVNEFWAPHLPHPSKGWHPHNLAIVYPEPRFFRSKGADFFIRHRDINEDTTNRKKNALAASPNSSKAPPSDSPKQPSGVKLPLAGMQESRHYVGAGDARCMLALTRWFERKDVRTTHVVAHAHDAWEHLVQGGESLLIIGNSRTNWVVRDVQDNRNPQLDIQFKIQSRGIQFKIQSGGIDDPQDAKKQLEDESSATGPRLAYASFVRRRHPDTNQVLSCILVNQGPLNELIAEYLMNEETLRELIDRELHLTDDQELPKEFEIVFGGKINTSDHPIAGSVKPIGHRLGRGPATVRKYND